MQNPSSPVRAQEGLNQFGVSARRRMQAKRPALPSSEEAKRDASLTKTKGVCLINHKPGGVHRFSARKGSRF